MTVGFCAPDFDFRSQYIEIDGSRLHYIDEGAGDPILFLHGNPTSCYLWRNVVSYLIPHGRCIAMDLIGMGGSDKPDIAYRFVDHYRYVEGFIEALGLERITLVVHDWGSALGFHYAMRHSANVKGIAFMEAFVKTSTWEEFPPDFQLGFRLFRTPLIGWILIGWLNVFIEQILPKGVVRKLSVEEMNFYRKPFRRVRDRRPLWRWTNEMPIEGKPVDVTAIVEDYSQYLQDSDLPKMLFYGHPGGLIGSAQLQWCKQNLPNLETVNLGKGIHYLQEDNPGLIGTELAHWYRKIDSGKEAVGAATPKNKPSAAITPVIDDRSST
jgi:haloalkane dehalogenase